MRIEIKHPAFKSQRLSVETGSIFAGPRLLLNGVVLKRKGRSYLVGSDSGQELAIKVMYNFMDPIPKVKIGEETIELAKPLQWYEYAWIGVPMLLVFAGGALGGFVGAGSTVVNGRIFRSDRGAFSKYALAGVTTLVGVVVFFALAVAFRLAIGAKK
jgi:hypothetical protein